MGKLRLSTPVTSTIKRLSQKMRLGTKAIAQWVESLPSTQKALGLLSSTALIGMVVHIYNLSP